MIISVDDKYLLVKNNHGLGLLQLPIRVYEIDDIKKVEIIHEKINAIIDSYPKRNWLDWRLLVPTNKVDSFYKTFESERRENSCDCSNVFDDLIENNAIDKEAFYDRKVKFLRRKHRPISYSRYTDHYEFNCVDYMNSPQITRNGRN